MDDMLLIYEPKQVIILLFFNRNWIERSFIRHPPHCVRKCVFVCNKHPCPLLCLLLSVRCVIAWWQFISSETFPFAWFSLNLQGKRNTFPSQIYYIWFRELSTIWYSTVCARSHTHKHTTHCIHTPGQYLSDGKVFSLRLPWLFLCIHEENI